jgi:superfamily II DNA/RNA helicase
MPEIDLALADVDITTPFPIQEMAVPITLLGTDLIGQARTGTGKTLAFAIPILQRVVSPHDPEFGELAFPGKPQALVVCPTRELALQVANDFDIAGARRAIRTLTVYGGVGYDDQIDALHAGVDVVVGTPGRLIDLSNRRRLDLSQVKVLVLDEADEMLDLGFLPDVEHLIGLTSELRQTMLFSATMPGPVIAMARTYMRHPVNVRAESADDTPTVPATAQFVYVAHDLDKAEIIARILQAENSGRTIIFTRTKRQAQRVADELADRGFSAAPLHGDMPQIAREHAMGRFRDGKVTALVATDVAARGIDVEGVTHVVNYSCPEDAKTYLHRIGRTGRAGATGVAITLVDWSDVTRWKLINTAHDLPFDEPAETYSTSPHLYHDLGIPTDATGRIAATPLDAGPSGSASRVEERRGPRRTGERTRTRRRTRRGKPVDVPAEQASATPPADDVQTEMRERSGTARKRSRRRRAPRTDTASASE